MRFFLLMLMLIQPVSALASDGALPTVYGTPRIDNGRMLFRLGDQGVCDQLREGDWDLAQYSAEIVFADPILPHENSEFHLLDGNARWHGIFASIQLPEDMLCKTRYDVETGRVTIHNFRPQRPPAFPGAEGFGKYTRGGRGGRVYAVTHLGDAGPGTFREACEAEGPRTVLFHVSGTIALESPLKIRHPYITIAGQSAPGDGICIKDHQVSFSTDEIIVRFIRFRPGADKGREHDGFGGEGSHIIVDHCSVSWSVDEALSINTSANITVQWCIVSESLYDSIHKKGKHGYGGLWGGPGGSFHHNILAHHSSRNPRASGNAKSGLLDFRNNVIYNWGFNSAYGGELWPRNWIGNFYKYGPATGESVRNRIFLQKDPRGRMYAAENLVWGFPDISSDNWNGGIHFSPDGEATEATLRVNEPYTVAPVFTHTAEEAFETALRHAGCSHVRDAVDKRIIEEIRGGTAQFGRSYGGGGKGIIDSPSDVGGWPALHSTTAPRDTDGDGMPDAWEAARGLNPNDPQDGSLDRNGDGYTNLEEYLNGLVINTFPQHLL